ncbi:MAG: transposase [Myxococcales bacterium]
MGRPHRNNAAGVTHHVYCRGNRGEKVFADIGDCEAFIEKLKSLAGKLNILVLAYCLMPNHFHICVRTQFGGSTLSKFMQCLNLWHARQFNRKHEVRGRLNESRFKSKVVDGDRYLVSLVRYIHQNPIRAGLESEFGQWRFTSHAAYLSPEDTWVAKDEVLRILGSVASYRRFVEGPRTGAQELETIRFRRKRALTLERAKSVLALADSSQHKTLRRACELFTQGRPLKEIAREARSSSLGGCTMVRRDAAFHGRAYARCLRPARRRLAAVGHGGQGRLGSGRRPCWFESRQVLGCSSLQCSEIELVTPAKL